MPSIAWRSSGSAGRTPSGMIGKRLPRRIEDRSRSAKLGSRGRWATDCAKPLTIVGRSRSSTSSTPAACGAFEQTSSAAGDERAEQRVGEPADPEERRVGEQHLVGRVAADLVQVVEVADQRAVRVDHALRLARRARGVHDREPVAGADRCLRRREDAGLDRPSRAPRAHRMDQPDRRLARLDERDAPQHRQRVGEQRRRRAEVELGHGLAQHRRVVVRSVRRGAEQQRDVGVAEQDAAARRRSRTC